jgi:PAT family beta-lactamase induction signal transducer AmpG
VSAESSTPSPPAKTGFAAHFLRPHVVFMLLLGFAAGLPFLLIFGTLSIWLREAGIERTEIGLLSYVGLIYTLKFIWAPVLDAVKIPVLSSWLGRRRSWMLVAQSGIMIALLLMAEHDPADGVLAMALIALFLAFCSATQDIVIDAWRIEAAPLSEQAVMSASYQLGYRLGAIASGAGALYIAEYASWGIAYCAMAALMGVGVVSALCAANTDKEASAEQLILDAHARRVSERMGGGSRRRAVMAWLYKAVVAPFADFVSRHRWNAALILAFIGAYRLPDFVMGVMAGPLYVDLGFAKSDIANVVKLYGLGMTIVGAFAGAASGLRFGLMRTLLLGVLAASFTNLLFAWLATKGTNLHALAFVISIENFAGGFAGTALIAYMSSLTSSTFTATQYALFSSFYALPGKLLGGMSGYMVDSMGYVSFFLMTAALGVPAVVLLVIVMRRVGR